MFHWIIIYISYYFLAFSATMQTQQSNASSVFLKNIQVNTDSFYNWTNWDYIWLNALPLSSFREVMRERTDAKFLQKLRILRLIIGKLTWPLLVNIFCFVKLEENKRTNKLACSHWIDLPVQGPIVINVQASYQPGEWVSLNCTSSPSNPIAILQWYIDGKLVSFIFFSVKRFLDECMMYDYTFTEITCIQREFE